MSWIFTVIILLLCVPGMRAAGILEPPLLWCGQVRNNAGGQKIRLTTGGLFQDRSAIKGGSFYYRLQVEE